jgi:hypothetical protein
LREYLEEKQGRAKGKSKFNLAMEYFKKGNFDLFFLQGTDNSI